MKYLFTTLFVIVFTVISYSQTTLTSLSPAKFQTQSDNIPMNLTINGKNIWPDHLTLSMWIDVTDVYFKKGDKVQVVRSTGVNKDKVTVSFFSSDWLTTPGTVEVFIHYKSIGGLAESRSNSLSFQVEETPKVSPVISSISPSKFETGLSTDKYYFRIYGKTLGEERTTYVTVGGTNAGIGWQNLKDGVIDVWVPKNLINNAGNYEVQVLSKYGSSNVVPLIIEKNTTLIKPLIISQAPQKTVIAKPLKVTNPHIDEMRRVMIPQDIQLIAGARVKLTGQMAFAEDISVLENFIRSLENVLIIDNQLQAANNANLMISINGRGINREKLDVIKRNIEDKTKAMGIASNVAIE